MSVSHFALLLHGGRQRNVLKKNTPTHAWFRSHWLGLLNIQICYVSIVNPLSEQMILRPDGRVKA